MSARATKTRTTRQQALQAAKMAVERYAGEFGEAQWTNGYRVGRPDQEATLFARERDQWQRAAGAEEAALTAIRAYGRVCAAEARKAK